MIKPDENDPLKVRRVIALMAAFNGLFIIPVAVPVLAIVFHLSDSVCGDVLSYMTKITIGGVLPWLYGVHKTGGQE